MSVGPLFGQGDCCQPVRGQFGFRPTKSNGFVYYTAFILPFGFLDHFERNKKDNIILLIISYWTEIYN